MSIPSHKGGGEAGADQLSQRRHAGHTAFLGLSAFSGAVYGALFGALIGREAWQPYDLGRTASFQMVPSGSGLALSLQF